MKNKKENKINESFRALKDFVSQGDVMAINLWFEEHKVKSRPIFRKKLLNFIIKETYFFSFSSNSFNKEYLNAESQRRQLAVIKHFNLDEQLDILAISIDRRDLCSQHFKALKIKTKEDRELIKNDNTIARTVTDLLRHQDFKLIDEIENILNYSILTQPCNSSFICYQQDNSTGMMISKIKYPEDFKFKPYYDILINFTSEKRDYLINKGIDLPNEKEAIEIINNIKANLQRDSYLNRPDNIELITKNFHLYLINTRFNDLQKEISSNKNVHKKSIKI